MAPAQDDNLSIFSRVKPGDEIPPPPPQLALWTQQTTLAVFVGMLYGGNRGLADARAIHEVQETASGKHNSVSDTLSNIEFKSRRHRATAYFVRGSIIQGARIGSFVSMVSALSLLLNGMRGGQKSTFQDPLSLAGAAGVTCGLFSGVFSTARYALKAALFGSAVGGSFGVTLSYLDSYALSVGSESQVSDRPDGNEDRSSHLEDSPDPSIDARKVIAWLEDSRRERSEWMPEATAAENSASSTTET